MILIDFSQTAYSNITYDVDIYNEYDDKVKYILGTCLNSILKIKKKFGKEFGEIVLACDSKNSWRKQVFPYYKANRKEARASIGDIDWDVVFESVDVVKSVIKESFPFVTLEVDGAEGDDVIASLVINADKVDSKESRGLIQDEVVVNKQLIVSRDEDFFQLHRYNYVSQYSTIKEEFITPDISPEAYLQEHILKGDRGDGVPSVLSDDDVFVTKTRQKPLTVKRKEELLSDMDALESNPKYIRNKTMIDLRYIPKNISDEIINSYMSYDRNRASSSNILPVLAKYKLSSLANRIEDFQ